MRPGRLEYVNELAKFTLTTFYKNRFNNQISDPKFLLFLYKNTNKYLDCYIT